MLPTVIATTAQFVDSVALLYWVIASAIGSLAAIWVIAVVVQCARDWNTPPSRNVG